MDNQLLTLSKIFTERLFRIPDYQRGYAWGDKQLKDFWGDIQQLELGHTHYTGVLTLEDVPSNTHNLWDDDKWIIEAKSYSPHFIVDGQQRLTTSIILIQAIIERIEPGESLNFTTKEDIQKKFTFDSKDEGISRSYIFGYEKDNPSYEFLKTKVFGERSSTGKIEETVYTQNLAKAKNFFVSRIAELTHVEIEFLYRKVTQQLLFNIFSITEDVDVCVAFETMNNRGKPLSYLELLKNRLIYLSIKFDAPDYERSKLRRAINDCWKSLYHSLGKNKEKPLDDDWFLLTHYLTYFGPDLIDKSDADSSDRYRKISQVDYSEELLERKFVAKNVTQNAPLDSKITLSNVYDYVSSLQDAVEIWYKIFNPFDSDLSLDEKIWLDKLNRIGSIGFLPLVLAVFQKISSEKKRVLLLQTIERRLFIYSLLTSHHYRYYRTTGSDPYATEFAIRFTIGEISFDKLLRTINEDCERLLEHSFLKVMVDKFRSSGFYDWQGIRYFLFEYNLSLQNKSKTERPKIFWAEFNESKSDFVTVEHIYPAQARNTYWTSRFRDTPQARRASLRNSLGNLLPLSRPKNSSLSNNPFPDKIEGVKSSFIGYRYGCYAENEVAKELEWTPDHILNRGLQMLAFMEQRWNIKLGSEDEKVIFLGLDFLKKS